MAAYDYRCRECETTFEVRRSVNADAGPVRCPGGHADVARIWSAVSVGGVATVGAQGGAAPAAGGCCGGGCCG